MSPCYKQQPTLTNVRIRTAQDALLVFYGVARGVLTLLTRRLDADERKAIRPGHVYVWEDRSATTSDSGGLSMERWTDGMSWGPSRIREEFLFYYQRDPQGSELSRPAFFRFRADILASRKKTNRPIHESDKLIKQTFSVYVSLPEDHPQDITRKWHLTAYFNQRTVDSLGKIDDVPGVGGLAVPENLFRSARAVKGRKEDIRRSMGQIIGPVSQQSFSPSTGSGALYTIFPSNAQHEPTPLTREPGYPSPTRARPPPPALVPLEYLQSIPPLHRDPTDILYLQRLSLSHSRDGSPAHSHTHPHTHFRSLSPEHKREAAHRDPHRRYA
ncbi:Gti1/Pac2 family-domain-containing protein [Vararia minispora EC-137]|uniref:Gti1/Pac2 family-domain-containing protein n=1 Tax=Vararia minispora EC-137 TaxID=1314806 RepID=A0ACB8QEV8_9AGAM|nr:Gti1/Pac2 family-domain-containing protein [Vararia minispora EC-137]